MLFNAEISGIQTHGINIAYFWFVPKRCYGQQTERLNGLGIGELLEIPNIDKTLQIEAEAVRVASGRILLPPF